MRVDTFYYWQEFLENTWGIFLRLLYLTQSYELLLLFSESRYLLLLTENYGALTILQQKMFTMDNAVVIFGSSFPRDQEYTQVFVDRMIVGFTTTNAISAYHHWCCEFKSRWGWGVQHYVIKFVSDSRQVVGFPRFPQPIKLTTTI
jgi:hypothetical protein